ncbi:hypothetical protein M0R45_005306 [Rubus argutus]|uniref:Uncharacterized protein n=1 Tax=Rubus argutus TaxID=59490 RepID=A0AAW1YMH6_RUBAR
MRKNKLVGLIPATFKKGNILRNLGLNGNQLDGPLPQALRNCTNLQVLDLGNNYINDTFPNWLDSLPMLQVLILRSNRFHGPISSPITRFIPFQKMRIMDLSHNNFCGPLPTKYFENFLSMMNVQGHELKYMGDDYYHDSVVVEIKGIELELVKILTFFTTIYFSNNAFRSTIPKEIGKLKSLKGLNFSHNYLTGSIPSSLGNLTELEWLDLSSNMLDGEIPRKLVDLTSLGTLNLSDNRLVGSIPFGKQFNTFENNSYLGNFGLCGYPLSNLCINEEAHPSSFQGEDDLEQENGFDWEVVLMGYGW